MFSLGMDLGASSIKFAVINENKELIYEKYVLHQGRIRETVSTLLDELLATLPAAGIRYAGYTGTGSSRIIGLEHKDAYIDEMAAVVEGSLHLHPDTGSIIEIGGQSARFITGVNSRDKSGLQFSVNSDCAAGTGSFLEEQVSRLGLKLEDFSEYTQKARSIPRIAGRCSVFAKTDMIHHQQEGSPVEDILLGLAYAVARNYKGTVMKKLPLSKPVFFAGGVAYNQGVVSGLQTVLELAPEEFIVTPAAGMAGAIGTALIALGKGLEIDLAAMADSLRAPGEPEVSHPTHPDYRGLAEFGYVDYSNKHETTGSHDLTMIRAYLGVDVGSTSTNLVVIDEQLKLIAYRYLKTLGKPAETVLGGLKELAAELQGKVEITGAGITGSGRYLIGELIGADVVKDEITAQARAAVLIDPEVDTIFEIGGQDSKYIRIENGIVTDFEMNKICAAGTGSFIEEQAKKLRIPLAEFSALAMAGSNPADLGDRCTVFIESNIAHQLARGSALPDIAAGLCYSVVRNYLGKVVGRKAIGNKIFFQGGVAYNQGVVNAFKALTGKNIEIPRCFSVTGAYGAALLAREEMTAPTRFKGFEPGQDGRSESGTRTESSPQGPAPGHSPHSPLQRSEALYLQDYDAHREPDRKTIGIPRILFLHKLFPLFNLIFRELGYNVLLSEATQEDIIRYSQAHAVEETCYPVKLAHGHVVWLLEQGVDYIFLPSLHTMKHEISKVREDYACVYMQTVSKLIAATIGPEQKGVKLLAPALNFKFGKKQMIKSMLALGKELDRSPFRMLSAIKNGMSGFKAFERSLEKNGDELAASLQPGEIAFVLISRPYNIADPGLNMRIPQKLGEMGYKVLTLSMLPAHQHDLFEEYPNMYWPFGQHILSGAQIVRQHPNLIAIYLTNHGCGPDTMLSHYFEKEMRGKPYLHIEVDEHASSVGVITRVEAFVNSLKAYRPPVEPVKTLKQYADAVSHQPAAIIPALAGVKAGSMVYLPHLYPYSYFLAPLLGTYGFQTEVLPATGARTLNRGRELTKTKEYLTLSALLGDVLAQAETGGEHKSMAILIPTCEGSEADGQYHRLLKTKLEDGGYSQMDIVASFLEDFPNRGAKDAEPALWALAAGDLALAAPIACRQEIVAEMIKLIEQRSLNRTEFDKLLRKIALCVQPSASAAANAKRLLITGDPLILHNDFLNDFSFRKLEDHAMISWQPLAEYLWFFWKDYSIRNRVSAQYKRNLRFLENMMRHVSFVLGAHSPYENDHAGLCRTADRYLSSFAGANGRYRLAKVLCAAQRYDGIITAAPMYENTATILSILLKNNKKSGAPVLELSFDGQAHESNATKMRSFLYFLN